jgi:hypothetical protein
MNAISKFLSSPFVVEYFKDVTLVVLVLIAAGFWFVARRRELIGAQPPEISTPRS